MSTISCPTFEGATHLAGSKKAESCSKHAEEAVFNVKYKPCGHMGVLYSTPTSAAGSKKLEIWAKHAEEGVITSCSTKP